MMNSLQIYIYSDFASRNCGMTKALILGYFDIELQITRSNRVMKKAFVCGTMMAFLAGSALLADTTVTTVGYGGNYGGYGPYQTGVGGEFTLFSTGLAGI